MIDKSKFTGKVHCEMCNVTALLYDEEVLPYLNGSDEIKSSHFIYANIMRPPENGEIIKCYRCGSGFLIEDIRREWSRVRKTREWDV